jgi:hypothetical protein
LAARDPAERVMFPVFGRRRRPPLESDLHRCPLCYDDSVVPVEAEPLELGRWEMRLRCGRCGTYRVFIAALEHDLIDAGDFASD